MNPGGCDTIRGEGNMGLTAREREVARLIAGGHSSKQIAADLGISFRTVVCHRFRIFQKLGVSNTAELVGQAVRMGLVDFFAHSSAPSDSRQPLSYRMSAMREENAKQRRHLAALLSESRLLRELSAANRKGLKEARRQMTVQVEQLMGCLNDDCGTNPQTAPDVRGDSSGLHPGSAEHVHAAGKDRSVSAGD